jgi:hypothetical protein
MIRVKIQTNDKPTRRGKIHEIIERALNEAVIAKAKELLGELREPQTGMEAAISFEVTDAGIVINIKGSDFVVQEARRRLNLLE